MLSGEVVVVVKVGCILQGDVVGALLAVDGDGVVVIVDDTVDAGIVARNPMIVDVGVEGLHCIVLEQAQVVEAGGWGVP